MAKNKREPDIIIFFALYYLILGMWGIVKSAHALIIFSKTGDMYSTIPLSLINIKRPFFGILPLFYIPSGIGILLLKKWGRILLIVASGITLANVIYRAHTLWHPRLLEEFGYWYLTFVVVIIVIPQIFTLYYLTRPKIKEQFK